MKTNKIYYGAAYYDEYMPYDRIEEDMRMIRNAGMNVIRIAESTWATMEPHDGVFDFTHLDRMLKAADANGIDVIIGTPTYAIPSWMAAKYPDILAVTKDGQEIYGRRQNMDITSPDYRFHAERIIRRMLEHIKDASCVIGFQLDNETKAYDTRGPRVQKMFLSYLKEQFPDLDAFNLEFGLNYWSNRVSSWEDFPNITGTINGSLDAEFRKFQRKLAADFLTWQAGIVNEYRRPDQFITQNFDFDWRGSSFGLQPDIDQVKAAESLSAAGVDIYHKSAAFLDGAVIHMGGAIGRSIKKANYLVLETEAQGNPGWLPYENQLRLQAYSHLSCGANSVMYWHWHSIHNSLETYWKGVLSHNLKENAIYREVCRIGHEFKFLGSKLINLQKQNQTAVMLSHAALTGLSEFPISPTLQYNEIFRWFMDALYHLNVDADIIYETDPDLSSYDTIIVPALYSAPADTIRRLKTFVAEGGSLIAGFKSFFADEYLKVYHDDQPHGLTEVFGMTYDRFTIPTREKLFFSKDILMKDEASGSSAPAADAVIETDVLEWMELLEPAEAQILAHYQDTHWKNTAAVTQNHYGKGQAVYIGCYFDAKLLEQLLARLLEQRGLLTEEARFPVVVKKGINEAGNRITYIMNYSDEPVSYFYRKSHNAMELLQGSPVSGNTQLTIPAWDLCILEEKLLPPYGSAN